MRFIKFTAGTNENPKTCIVNAESVIGVFRFGGQGPSLQTSAGNYPLDENEAEAIIEQLAD